VAAAVVEASTVVGAAAFTVGAVEAFTAAAAFMVGADIMAAGGLLVEEVTAKGEAFVVGQRLFLAGWGAVRMAGLKRGAASGSTEIVRRVFVRPSTMGSGIRSAVPVVPRV
jgi:hypothetical protein